MADKERPGERRHRSLRPAADHGARRHPHPLAAAGRADALRHRGRLPHLYRAPERGAAPHRRHDRAAARGHAHRLDRAENHDGRAAGPAARAARAPGDGALSEPFRRLPATIPQEAREKLALDGQAAVQAWRPACRSSKTSSATTTCRPRAEHRGLQPARRACLVRLPGEERHHHRPAPAEIHALGLKEVARIRTEIAALIPARASAAILRNSSPSCAATRACSTPSRKPAEPLPPHHRARRQQAAAAVQCDPCGRTRGQAGAGRRAPRARARPITKPAARTAWRRWWSTPRA
jgi:hypothetical protein